MENIEGEQIQRISSVRGSSFIDYTKNSDYGNKPNVEYGIARYKDELSWIRRNENAEKTDLC